MRSYYLDEDGVNVVNDTILSKTSSNKNLLDNWYFANPINQRPYMEYNTPGYTIDRWKNASAENLTISVLDDCVHLSSTVPGSDVLWIFSQPFTMNDSGLRPGITMTLSFLAKFTSSELGHANVQVDNDTQHDYHVSSYHPVVLGEKNVYSLTFSLPETWGRDDSLRCTLYGGGLAEVDVYAGKLEFGSWQTLVYQDGDGDWVLNDPPPNKAVELAKCTRFYRQYGPGLTAVVQGGMALFYFPFEMPMRANPWIVLLKDNISFFDAVNDGGLNLFNISIHMFGTTKTGCIYILLSGTWSRSVTNGEMFRYNDNTDLFGVDANL